MRLLLLVTLCLLAGSPATADNDRTRRNAIARQQAAQRRAIRDQWAAIQRERLRRHHQRVWLRLHDHNLTRWNQRRQSEWFRVTPHGAGIRRWDGSWFRQTPGR